MPNEYTDFECLSNSYGEREAFKLLQKANEEQKIVQRQIDSRVAQIIRLTREVQNMTGCPHDNVHFEWKIDVFCPRCDLCRAWLE